MFGSSTRVIGTLRRLSELPEPKRTNAVWVYNHLVCIDHLRDGPWLVGTLAGVVFLVLAGSIVIFLLGPVDMIKTAVGFVVLFAGCSWACKYIAKELWYQPRIDRCVAQLRQGPFSSFRDFRDVLTDIEQYDPEVVRMWQRLWGRPKLPPA
ncbi:MAG: hypothetical protein WC734_05190 [Patescibacteria group bacterium]